MSYFKAQAQRQSMAAAARAEISRSSGMGFRYDRDAVESARLRLVLLGEVDDEPAYDAGEVVRHVSGLQGVFPPE